MCSLVEWAQVEATLSSYLGNQVGPRVIANVFKEVLLRAMGQLYPYIFSTLIEKIHVRAYSTQDMWLGQMVWLQAEPSHSISGLCFDSALFPIWSASDILRYLFTGQVS